MPSVSTRRKTLVNCAKNSNDRSTRPILLRSKLRCCLFSILGAMALFSLFQRKAVSGMATNTTPVTGTTSTAVAASTATARSSTSTTDLEDRLRGALWGFLAGDALASPTHWYYGGTRQIISEYGHKITDYTKPNRKLAGSILNKSDLNGGGRSKGFFGGGGGAQQSKGKPGATIIGDVINHGKQDLWSPNQSNHYHATLQKGENTLEVSIARVLMKSIVATGGKFNADHFRQAYVDFMTTPGSHNDTYASTCHRMFFYNMIFRQLPPKDCPDNDNHNVDTIDGLVLPTIVALTGVAPTGGNDNERAAVAAASAAAAAAECAAVTRKSSVLERLSASWSRVVVAAVQDDTSSTSRNGNNGQFDQVLNDFAQQTLRRRPNPLVDDSSTMSACYLSSALPGLVDLIAKYNKIDSGNNDVANGVWQGLLANANVGGENVHRGSVMGAILGARSGVSRLPPQLIQGLYPQDELRKEIDDFVRAVLP